MTRCSWCGTDPLYVAYHDEDWGVPEYDPRALWEKLVLDGFQAGLSWITILRKRDNFRQEFDGFDPERVAGYDETDVARLMGDAGIVRNRAKVLAAITNARALVALREAQGADSLERLVREQAGPGDMVVCLGAGTISTWANALPAALEALKKEAV